MSRYANFFAPLLIAIVSVVGCGRQLREYPVSGQVTLDRSPIASGAVIFVPNDGERNPASFVIEVGEFRSSDRDGLPEGEYSVVIAPFALELEQYEARKNEEPELLAPPQIPEVYTKPGKFFAKVTPNSENFFTFELFTQEQQN